jgi:prepilin-type N-terminal cleavage/methylation domain-containing protein
MAPVSVKRREGGFTLIEVMIALVLTAVAIMGIIALYITETKASGFSRHTTEGAVLAQDKVESMRTQGSAANFGPVNEVNINERGLAGGIFTRQTTETLIPVLPVGGPYTWADVLVTVTWNDDGINHQVQVRSRRNL